MKVLVILVDGAGAFRCAHVRNPSIFRQEIARETGDAHILYLGAAVAAISVAELMGRLETCVLPRFEAAPGLRDNLYFQIRVEWERLRMPLAEVFKTRVRAMLGITVLKKMWLRTLVAEGRRNG